MDSSIRRYTTRSQRLTITLTVINLVVLMFNLTQTSRTAAAQDVPQVLRAHALEIVDAQGRVRASITVYPRTTVNSKEYPETVLLRLTDPKSGPVVELSASEEGSALGLSDDSSGGVQL
jgi:hypothetical protein